MERAIRHGLVPAALSICKMEAKCGAGLLLSFTNIPREAAMEMAVRLKRALNAQEFSR